MTLREWRQNLLNGSPWFFPLEASSQHIISLWDLRCSVLSLRSSCSNGLPFPLKWSRHAPCSSRLILLPPHFKVLFLLLLLVWEGGDCCSVTKLCPESAIPWTAACQASLSFINSRSMLKLMSIEMVIPSNHLVLCHPLLLLPSIFPSLGVFSSGSVLPIKWPKY